MNHSTFVQPLPPALSENAAKGFYLNGGALPGGWNIYPEMAAAGLWTTPEDLCHFISAMQMARNGGSGSVVSPSVAKIMLQLQVGYAGLGLMLSSDGKRFWHNGRTIGFDSLMFGSRNLGGAVMINRNVNGGATLRILQTAAEVAEGLHK
jgi:CubicO group peptidase (beta-lactamase class C family)